jgi:hypothetical protein
LLLYAITFFVVPCVRAAYCHWENKTIAARNARRRIAAGGALREIIAVGEDKRDRARGAQRLEIVTEIEPAV